MHTGSPKGRIGVMTPPALLLDKEYWTWAPQDVSVFFTRMDYVARADDAVESARRSEAREGPSGIRAN